jgi:ubiquinone/menaquinone biosynthesis C-methylase UbiE
MKQSLTFLHGEGEAWMARNAGRYDENSDPVLEAIDKYKLIPDRVLEVGCADGARLEVMQRMWGCHVEGYDPAYGSKRGSSRVQVWAGTADRLQYSDEQFDMLIYGWCLYLCDPDDYFKIALEGDRILRDGGHLVVYDFYPDHTFKVPYKHKAGLFSHHFDFSKLWLAHPTYSLCGRTVQGETSVTILQKDTKNAFPAK